jgi:hypothetical protein
MIFGGGRIECIWIMMLGIESIGIWVSKVRAVCKTQTMLLKINNN